MMEFITNARFNQLQDMDAIDRLLLSAELSEAVKLY